MSRVAAAALAVALGWAGSAGAQAWDQLAYYIATIGPEDFYNSSGVRLTDPGAVLQQDRANVHRFGIRHPGDEADPVFGDRAQRARLPALYAAGGREPWFEDDVRRGALVRIGVFVCGPGYPQVVYLVPAGYDHSGCF